MSGVVIALHLIHVIRDAIDLYRRILNRLDGAIGGLGRLVRGDLRLLCGLLCVSGRSLRLRRRSLSLLSSLFVVRGASCERDPEHESCQE